MKSEDKYKIGHSKDVIYRLSQLKTGNPDIELLSECDSSIVTESALQSLYHKKRTDGEWFDLSSSDVENIVTLMERTTKKGKQKSLDNERGTTGVSYNIPLDLRDKMQILSTLACISQNSMVIKALNEYIDSLDVDLEPVLKLRSQLGS
tara:strand:- start:71 stop:517 length:447 start_codon:yes stop_codon:yes gene_type:complete